MPIEVHPVDSRADRKAFLELEKRLYADNRHWVPPLWEVRKQLCGFKPHPFYDDAVAQAFLARRDGRVVGRVLAIQNHAHNRVHNDQIGFFGFFECEDDRRAASELLAAAEDWLRRRGCDAIRGPVHPSLNYEVGLLVDGFDSDPTFLMTYNFNYYESLITGSGYQTSQDLYSYDAAIAMLEDLDPKLKFIVEESRRRFKVECRPLDRSRFNQEIDLFLNIYNRSLGKTWGAVPMSEAEVREQGKGLRFLLVPRLTSIAEIDGAAVGVGFGLLDYNPIIKKIGGHLFPFGWMRLLWSRGKIKRLRLVSTNVLPEYQRWGLGLVTLYPIMPAAMKYGIRVGEFSWVLSSNQLSWKTIERGGARRTKTHRLYDKALVPAPAGATADPPVVAPVVAPVGERS